MQRTEFTRNAAFTRQEIKHYAVSTRKRRRLIYRKALACAPDGDHGVVLEHLVGDAHAIDEDDALTEGLKIMLPVYAQQLHHNTTQTLVMQWYIDLVMQ